MDLNQSIRSNQVCQQEPNYAPSVLEQGVWNIMSENPYKSPILTT